MDSKDLESLAGIFSKYCGQRREILLTPLHQAARGGEAGGGPGREGGRAGEGDQDQRERHQLAQQADRARPRHWARPRGRGR